MLSPSLQLVLIIVIGTLCQIIGWCIQLPSILLLLLAGIFAGPVYGLIQPDNLFGSLLNPLIEFAVAVILFEGGLSLSQTELGKIGRTVLRLLTFSVLITWILLGTASYYILSLSGPASVLLGAILVISGPTVVIPLLRLIHARAPVEPILRWEGILIDPIGVVLAVLVAEVSESGFGIYTPWHIGSGIIMSLGIGFSMGWIGAQVLSKTIGQHRVSDQFIVPLSLAVLFSLVTISNIVHEQSGLLTSTMMGLFVANNKKAWVQTIEDFIGHTQSMFIGVLFVILAARLEPGYVRHIDINLIIFIVIAIFLIRPISVFISTIGTELKFRDKIAIAALAPRGIVSAALASSLGVSLMTTGVPGMQYIVPYTFATIIGTVTIYGLFTPLIFQFLGARQFAREGVLFVGGGNIALSVGKVLEKEGFRVAFVDTNDANIRRLREADAKCLHGSILSDRVQEELDMDGIGNLLAFTSNNEANSLAAAEFKHVFGSARVFQLSSGNSQDNKIGGRILCSETLTIDKIEELWHQGYRPFSRDLSGEIQTNIIPATEDTTKEYSRTEYVFAEIEKEKLYILAHDNLQRPAKPNKQIIFGYQEKSI